MAFTPFSILRTPSIQAILRPQVSTPTPAPELPPAPSAFFRHTFSSASLLIPTKPLPTPSPLPPPTPSAPALPTQSPSSFPNLCTAIVPISSPRDIITSIPLPTPPSLQIIPVSPVSDLTPAPAPLLTFDSIRQSTKIPLSGGAPTPFSSIFEALPTTIHRDTLAAPLVEAVASPLRDSMTQFPYTMATNHREFPNRAGIPVSQLGTKSHPHPVHKTVEVNLLHNVWKHHATSPASVPFMKPSKFSKLQRENQHFSELHNYRLTPKDTVRYPDTSHTLPRTHTVFMHDALMYHTPGQILNPFASAPELQQLYATLSSLQDNYDVPTGLLNAISCEIFGKWLSGEDPHKTTMDTLDIVQHHDWDEKVVLVLGVFAVKDGEFWLVAQLHTTNPLAKAIGQLKQVQEILERAGTTLKPKFESYNNLVRAIINVTMCVVQLLDLQRDPHVTTEHESAATTAHIPTAVYWTIRSIVVAASQLLGITGMGPEYLTETWELSSLAHKLEDIHSHLQENLDRLYEIIQRKKDDEALAPPDSSSPQFSHIKAFLSQHPSARFRPPRPLLSGAGSMESLSALIPLLIELLSPLNTNESAPSSDPVAPDVVPGGSSASRLVRPPKLQAPARSLTSSAFLKGPSIQLPFQFTLNPVIRDSVTYKDTPKLNVAFYQNPDNVALGVSKAVICGSVVIRGVLEVSSVRPSPGKA